MTNFSPEQRVGRRDSQGGNDSEDSGEDTVALLFTFQEVVSWMVTNSNGMEGNSVFYSVKLFTQALDVWDVETNLLSQTINI